MADLHPASKCTGCQNPCQVQEWAASPSPIHIVAKADLPTFDAATVSLPPPVPFAESKQLRALLRKIQRLYLADDIPWVIGYSGGKDSTATVQLVWLAIRRLPKKKRLKEIHIISTDTRVENPIVLHWATRQLNLMDDAALAQQLPIFVYQLQPHLKGTFWVNLLGRGYASPRPKFRWCTVRMKINPANAFMKDLIAAYGEVLLVLGTRKAESKAREKRMTELEQQRVRPDLSPSPQQKNCWVFTPIENWSHDDVWALLKQVACPWGGDNEELFDLYQGASEDGECPLVLDTDTPSCGKSRFGCSVCTMVSKDKSMTSMIANDPNNAWLQPLLAMRDRLATRPDRHLRDFRRTNGRTQLMPNGVQVIPGGYRQAVRENLLRDVLKIQRYLRTDPAVPPEYRSFEYIGLDELEEIRRLWVEEQHQFEDRLPDIYESVMGHWYPQPHIERPLLDALNDFRLQRIRAISETQYGLVRDMIAIAWQRQRAGQPVDQLTLYAELWMGRYRHESEANAIASLRFTKGLPWLSELETRPTDPKAVALVDQVIRDCPYFATDR